MKAERKRRRIDRHSIMVKMVLPMAAVIVFQSCLFAGLIGFGGMVDQMNSNAMDIFNERVIGRKNYLENEMIQRWSNLTDSRTAIQSAVATYLHTQGMAEKDLVAGSPQTTELLQGVSQDLIYLMRKNSVTGAFVILEGQRGDDANQKTKAGLYFRDLDPVSTPSDYSDLMLERGSATLAKSLDIPMAIGWMPLFTIEPLSEYYNKPLWAAEQYPEISAEDLGYWSTLEGSFGDRLAVTYTEPLVSPDGEVYGIIGVELDASYLRQLLPYSELDANKDAGYMLAIAPDYSASQTDLNMVVSSGPIMSRLFQQNDVSFADTPVYEGIYRGENTDDALGEIYGSIQPINLYNSNTPFENERWVLIGATPKHLLFAFSGKVRWNIVLFLVVSLVLGTLFAVSCGYVVVRPIRSLARRVRDIDPGRPVQLNEIHVREIDNLSSAIEALSRDVAESSSRLTKIIEMAQIPIGAFEIALGGGWIYYTQGFFELFGLQRESDPECLPKDEFIARFRSVERYCEKEQTNPDGSLTLIYRIPNGLDGYRWIRLKTLQTEKAALGVVVDITQEVLEKQKIEYERDYDLLTSLLNRRAFLARMAELEADPEYVKIGAFLMMDLDNLKAINDTFGHEAGDEYLRCTANVLRRFSAYGALVARMSGDEFLMFFSGYDSREKLEQVLAKLRNAIDEEWLVLPDGNKVKLRASAGVAWYPQDSCSITELMQFADFAMYEVKHGEKGGIKDFDIGSYRRDSFMLYSCEELNRLIDEQAVDYYFQPILRCDTGEVLGYEALMRPRSKSLQSPLDVLRIARSQSKLYQIERLTWFQTMQAFSTLEGIGEDTLVFVNSIANQSLTEKDQEELDTLFSPWLHRVVLELTEGDEINQDFTEIKQKWCDRHHARMALDDFGTGYSNNSVLLQFNPNYIKIDMSIVREINVDEARQELFSHIVSFCRQRKIGVIAEGVETQAEMETVVSLGAQYIQGFYFSRPAAKLIPINSDRIQALKAAYARYAAQKTPRVPPEHESDSAGR